MIAPWTTHYDWEVVLLEAVIEFRFDGAGRTRRLHPHGDEVRSLFLQLHVVSVARRADRHRLQSLRGAAEAGLLDPDLYIRVVDRGLVLCVEQRNVDVVVAGFVGNAAVHGSFDGVPRK